MKRLFPPNTHVLVVDDDNGHRAMLEALLGKWGLLVSSAIDGEQAIEAVMAQPFDLVLMDVRMARLDGISALKAIQKYNPAVPVIIMTAYSTVQSAVEALKSGAYDYLVKPLDFDALQIALQRTLEHRTLRVENDELRKELACNAFLDRIVGTSKNMLELKQMIAMAAPSEATVLITGKSGTGKELVAQAIHALSQRAHKPLVVLNCAALSENLLESELFGHEKGAYTGAIKQRQGRFMQADGGTLFLDEVGELPLSVQAKLLRALQQREIQRVGSDTTFTVNVRLIAATNRDLAKEVQEKRFREDLFYRLNVFPLSVPAIDDRREDIPLLVLTIVQRHAKKYDKNIKGLTPQSMDALLQYPWPGNVREMENVLERAVVLCSGKYITERELPPSIGAGATLCQKKAATNPVTDAMPFITLEQAEKTLILQTLEQTDNNKSEAAKRLGIARKTLHSKLKLYDIE